MPIIDGTIPEHPCAWCGTRETFLCQHCHKYTCRDCLCGVLEDGCVHKLKSPALDQGWYIPTGMTVYSREYGLYVGPGHDRGS